MATLATTACGSFGTTPLSMEPINGDDVSSSTPTPPTSIESDAAVPPSSPSADAGPKTLLCGRATNPKCGPSEMCCITDASKTQAECITDRDTCRGADKTVVHCRVAADCGGGQFCCVGKRAPNVEPETHCAAACAPKELQLCDDTASPSECPSGMRCTDDDVESEFGLTDIYEVCRPKADAGTTSTTSGT